MNSMAAAILGYLKVMTLPRFPSDQNSTATFSLARWRGKSVKSSQKVELRDYKGPLRQLLITDLGHEQPTIVLTNDLDSTAAKRIVRYAKRMLIENGLADSVDFFHLDTLSAAIRIRVDFDVVLTEIASGLYRMMARSFPGFETAKARQIFRHFLDIPAQIQIGEYEVDVTFPKRAHNPLLIAAGLPDKTTLIPWWENHRLSLRFR